jgi:hypothetical protein
MRWTGKLSEVWLAHYITECGTSGGVPDVHDDATVYQPTTHYPTAYSLTSTSSSPWPRCGADGAGPRLLHITKLKSVSLSIHRPTPCGRYPFVLALSWS